jgi:hypothetical protein
MDANRRTTNLWEWDPDLPSDWRFRDARILVRGETPQWSARCRAAIHDCAQYLRAQARAVGHGKRRSRRRSTLAAAHELAGREDPVRWEVEARILAGQSDSEIATRCHLPADVIGTYAEVFFDVRPRLAARGWIAARVIGPGLYCGFSDGDVGALWAMCGWSGGVCVLNAFIDNFRRVWQPDEPATLSVYLRRDVGITPRMQAFVAASVLPLGEAWLPAHRWLVEAGGCSDEDRAAFLHERARAHLIRCARAYLSGRDLPGFGERRRILDNERVDARRMGPLGDSRQSVLQGCFDEIAGFSVVPQSDIALAGLLGHNGYDCELLAEARLFQPT